MKLGEENIEIANPQQAHVATVLVLDISGSMGEHKKINQLNEGLQLFKEEVLKDELASKRVDLAVVTFGDKVNIIHKFSSIEDFEPPTLSAGGSTSMGEAILAALNLIETRKKEYKSRGISYYRPWFFMITDADHRGMDMQPGDSFWNKVVGLVHEVEINKKAMIFGVGVEPADMQLLKQIVPPNRPPLKLKKGMFNEMFEWLSKSLTKVSVSKVGDSIKLDHTGWGEVSTEASTEASNY
ncbi:MAG: VWA domain-containing protein [Candidatus Methanoperedens sp.]